MPLLVATHEAHTRVTAWCTGRELAFTGQSLGETYSVLTRLPGDVRFTLADAARVLSTGFSPPIHLSARAMRCVQTTLSAVGIAGGAVYDALVALAALEHYIPLATRAARARSTYEALGAEVLVAEQR